MASGSGADVEYLYVFANGFPNTVGSYRGEDFGWRLRDKGIRPHIMFPYKGQAVSEVSISNGLAILDEVYTSKGEKPMRIIAMDIAAFFTATYAAKHPERVNKLVFLCPVFNLEETWKTFVGQLDPTTLANWKRDGELDWVYGEEKDRVKVPYSCVEDSLQYPGYPRIDCDVLAFFGKHDVFCPPRILTRFKEEQRNPDLIRLWEFEDELNLYRSKSYEIIIEQIPKFFFGE